MLSKDYHVNKCDLVLAGHLIYVNLALIVAPVYHKLIVASPLVSAASYHKLDLVRELSNLRLHVLVLDGDHLDGVDGRLSPDEVLLVEAAVNKGLL